MIRAFAQAGGWDGHLEAIGKRGADRVRRELHPEGSRPDEVGVERAQEVAVVEEETAGGIGEKTVEIILNNEQARGLLVRAQALVDVIEEGVDALAEFVGVTLHGAAGLVAGLDAAADG